MATRHVRDPKTGDLIILNETETAIYEERLRIAEEQARKRKRIGCLLKVFGVLFLLFLLAICSGGDDDKKTSSKSKAKKEVVNSKEQDSKEKSSTDMNELVNKRQKEIKPEKTKNEIEPEIESELKEESVKENGSEDEQMIEPSVNKPQENDKHIDFIIST